MVKKNHETVVAVAKDAQKLIMERLELAHGKKGKTKWLLYGRIVMLLFEWHFQLAIHAAEGEQSKREGDPAQAKGEE